MLKLKNLDADFFRAKFIKRFLSVVTSIIGFPVRPVAPCVIASHNEMRAAIIFPTNGVPHRFPRARIPHRCRKHAQEHMVCGVILFNQHLVTIPPDTRRHIVAFGFSHEGVNHKSVHRFQSAFGQVFMCAVDWISGLKRRHRLPPFFLKIGARLNGVTPPVQKILMRRPREQ